MASRARGPVELSRARLLSWFGVDEPWTRVPADRDRTQRLDATLAMAFVVAGSLGVELLRSMDGLGRLSGAYVWPHVAVLAGTLPLAVRRRWPLLVAGWLSLHFLVVGIVLPPVAMTMPLQVVYFLAIFTGVAWARDRRAMLLVVSGIVVLMFGWLTWQLAVGSGVEQALGHAGTPLVRRGLFSPATAYVTYTLLVNVLYFGGAIIGGQAAWRAALHRERLAAQALTIEAQAAELQRRAVVEERLRIARELHDVVAHHVSVIGIQAAAARRTLRRDADVAEASLKSVEASSRDAVTQMRALLGTLRSGDDEARGARREPEPRLTDLPGLVAGARRTGLDASYHLVEDAPGALDTVPGPMGLSLYRTVQEALANVRRHSTARSAQVYVRVDRRPEVGFARGYAEVEVLDDGRPRHGTSGTGLGLLGIRERLATHGGTGEIGPRVTGGYRVRVRMPLPEESP